MREMRPTSWKGRRGGEQAVVCRWGQLMRSTTRSLIAALRLTNGWMRAGRSGTGCDADVAATVAFLAPLTSYFPHVDCASTRAQQFPSNLYPYPDHTHQQRPMPTHSMTCAHPCPPMNNNNNMGMGGYGHGHKVWASDIGLWRPPLNSPSPSCHC